MKVTFVFGGYESLAIEQLSSVLKAGGHQASLVYDPMLFNDGALNVPFLNKIFDQKDALVEQIISGKPDLIAFSVVTYTYQWAIDLAGRIKQRSDLPIIFGGTHPSLLPERVLQNRNVDMVCVGEGERPLLELVNSMNNGEMDHGIKNIWFKKDGTPIKNPLRPLLQELDALPFPDKDLFFEISPSFKKYYTVMTARGCPYNCTFCCNHALRNVLSGQNEKWVRRMSVDRIIREIKWAKDKYNMRMVFFLDEVFANHREWNREFALRYKKEIGLPFKCITHPNIISAETIERLKDAGCVEILLGIQSVNEASRKKVLKRLETNDQILNACAMIKEAKIDFTIDHIFGIPHEGIEDHINAAKFYNEIRPTRVYLYGLAYFPKTELLAYLKSIGMVGEADIQNAEEGNVGSIFLGGEAESSRRYFKKFNVFFMLLPLLPKRAVSFIIDKKLFRFLPSSANMFKLIRIIDLLLKNDTSSKARLLYYAHFLSAWMRKKVLNG